ncbi:MAG: DUF6114 domain-containing protein [Thaumarchaeota archaeon]|nr:DUF6114 domain-containing protein [Nitrososphaerota archaeon]
MTQQKETFPNTASVLAIIAGSLMIAAAVIILIFSAYVVPYMNNFISQGIRSGAFNVTSPHFNGSFINHINGTTFSPSQIPGFVASLMQGIGLFGLISGIIVLVSGAMIRTNPSQRTLWGVLILVFSVLSFFGTGGFVIGAILGILGGIMTLTWRAPTATTAA